MSLHLYIEIQNGFLDELDHRDRPVSFPSYGTSSCCIIHLAIKNDFRFFKINYS